MENDCGLDANSVMNTPEGSTLKSGLIEATTIVANTLLFQYPLSVVIDNIIDMTANCSAGNNCLLVLSTIHTVVMPVDDEDTIKETLVDGIKDSFEDGTFFENVPQNAVECPTEIKGVGWNMMKADGEQ